MAIITLSSGENFAASAGISILDAATQANLPLPYSCKTGRCSTCKCKVLSGTSIALHPESGITDGEKAEGWILSCVRSAETDLVLEVDDLDGMKLPRVATIPCKIDKIEHLAPDVAKVLLRLSPAADFKFIPGQYIDIIGTGGTRRSYSIANAMASSKTLELHIRAVDGGEMSEYWFKRAKANDLLRLNGPLGSFFLRNSENNNVIFLATGTGIAPVKAILESIPLLDPKQKPKSITIFWGARNQEDLYFDISKIPGNHRFIPVLSRGKDDWEGARGYVQNALLASNPDLSNTTVYACGSDSMIHGARKALFEAGLASKRFYSDAFVPSGNN